MVWTHSLSVLYYLHSHFLPMSRFTMAAWKVQVSSIYFERLLKDDSRIGLGLYNYMYLSEYIFGWLLVHYVNILGVLCFSMFTLHFGPNFLMLNLGVTLTLKERAPGARGTPVDVGLSKVKPYLIKSSLFYEYLEWKQSFSYVKLELYYHVDF